MSLSVRIMSVKNYRNYLQRNCVGEGDVVDVGYIMEKLPNLESLTINGTFTDTSFKYDSA